MNAGQIEIARFLAARPPFAALAPGELGEVVVHTEVEFHPSGAAILTEEGGPVTFLRVVHSGAVHIVHDGNLLDLLGPGDTFGHAAMLSGLPPGFEARASEDTLCYRIPAAAARPLLERARSRELAVGVHEPGHQPVAELIRSPAVRCAPADTIAETAQRMSDAGANAAVIDLPGGAFGIFTDRDLRTRVVAAGVAPERPIEAVMSAPAFTVTPDRLGGEVLFEMLERGIRHAPIVSESGRLVGVVEDGDLFAVHPRSWFGARRAVARARDADELAQVAGGLPAIMLDLHVSNLRALEVARVLSALIDAVTARALELAAAAHPLPADGVVWVAVGSHARRELTPASAARGALVCSESPPPAFMRALAGTLAGCGLTDPVRARSPGAWRAASPADALALELLIDRRALFGTPREALPQADGAKREETVAALRARVAAQTPPTGFEGDAVLAPDGVRRERLDIARAVLGPIVEIARWAGAIAGRAEGSTPERLRAAAADGILGEVDAGTLADAFELAFEARIEHQMQQLANGRRPDDLLAPAALSPLARAQLRDVFRAIAGVQRTLPA